MGWRLELVETGSAAAGGCIVVCDIGEIAAPAGIDDVGLGLNPSQSILGAIQRAVVGLTIGRARCRLCSEPLSFGFPALCGLDRAFRLLVSSPALPGRPPIMIRSEVVSVRL